MEIIRPEDTERWGKKRLHGLETWPGADLDTRQFLASQVVDTFHKKAHAAGLNLRWMPRVPLLICEEVDGVVITDVGGVDILEDTGPLERWLEESFDEVGAGR